MDLGLAASIDMGTAIVVLLAVAALVALISRAVMSGDPDRIREDLARRGARMVRCTRTRGGGRDERVYEVVYVLEDGVERQAVCKTSSFQGEWWQGEVPPVIAAAPPAAAPSSEPAAQEAAAEEVADIDPAVALEGQWRAEADPDRESEEEEAAETLRPVEELIEVLRGGESRACERAVEELVKHGEAAVPALTAALDDPDADVRVDAKKALQRIQEG